MKHQCVLSGIHNHVRSCYYTRPRSQVKERCPGCGVWDKLNDYGGDKRICNICNQYQQSKVSSVVLDVE